MLETRKVPNILHGVAEPRLSNRWSVMKNRPALLRSWLSCQVRWRIKTTLFSPFSLSNMNSLRLFFLPKATPGYNTLGCHKHLRLLKILVISGSSGGNVIVSRWSHSDERTSEISDNMEFTLFFFFFKGEWKLPMAGGRMIFWVQIWFSFVFCNCTFIYFLWTWSSTLNLNKVFWMSPRWACMHLSFFFMNQNKLLEGLCYLFLHLLVFSHNGLVPFGLH